MSSFENPNFLKKKYDLHNSLEVNQSVRRTEIRTGEKISNIPESKIQNYLDRFKEILDRPNENEREHGIKALKQILHDKFVIKPDKIPESYFTNQQRLARERGYGDIELDERERQGLSEVIITDQRSSLNNWIDYLSSKDATYPDWLKYYAFRSIINMGAYDKEKHVFGSRSTGTTKPFPDINREALAYVLDAIEKKYQSEDGEIQAESEFLKLIGGENFAKLYAYAIEKVTPASKEAMECVQGEWVKYEQGTDHMPLVKSLQGHGTGWCTAGESTAKAQLEDGDFYVFYSLNENSQPKIPRAAIRMEGNKIGEVRGIAVEQNLDPLICGVVQEKLTEFPDGESYNKKVDDMNTLTIIDKKIKENEHLTQEELIFLYEINGKIEGFGYENDPRIEDIIHKRISKEDLSVIYNCSSDEIAETEDEINVKTKTYFGKLCPKIFSPNIENIFLTRSNNGDNEETAETGKIELYSVTIGGISRYELQEDINKGKIEMNESAEKIISNDSFNLSDHSENVKLVRLTPAHLGFNTKITLDEFYKKAEEFNLCLCPAEVGLQLCYQHIKGNYAKIAMKLIDSEYGQKIFALHDAQDNITHLVATNIKPDSLVRHDDEMFFKLSRSE